MIDRIKSLLAVKNISSSQFANEIGVQRSGISHILSGRNKPSLDFILKILDHYPELNESWLLRGEGEMYKEISQKDLFEETGNEKAVVNEEEKAIYGIDSDKTYSEEKRSVNHLKAGRDSNLDDAKTEHLTKAVSNEEKGNSIVKIIVVYDDNSFKILTPR